LDVESKDALQQAKVMGMMVEESENKMRTHIENVYFDRVKGIVEDLRSIPNLSARASGRMVLPVGQ